MDIVFFILLTITRTGGVVPGASPRGPHDDQHNLRWRKVMGNRESLVRAVVAEDDPDFAIPLLQASPAPGCIFDLDSGEILSVNTAFTDLLDYPDGEDPAASAPALFPRSGDWQILGQALARDGVYRGSDLALRGATATLVLGEVREGGLRYTARGLGAFDSVESLAALG